jgi:enoyl-CoA hydratase
VDAPRPLDGLPLTGIGSSSTATSNSTVAADYASLAFSDDGNGVRQILLTRPELLNRFDALLHVELTACLRQTAAEPGVRAIVLASTGKAFSAGGDFDLMMAAHTDPVARRSIVDDARHLLDALLDLEIPIIAAVQGAAMGLGATVALACDGLVASRNVVLADTHVNIGLVAGDGGCLMWPAAAGMLRARRHLLTGDPLPAELAFTLGMVTDLVDTPDEVGPAAHAIAARIAANAPLAVRMTKRALNELSRRRAAEVVDLALGYEEQTLATDDLAEGVAAFRAKRTPAFRGT